MAEKMLRDRYDSAVLVVRDSSDIGTKIELDVFDGGKGRVHVKLTAEAVTELFAFLAASVRGSDT